MASDDDNEPGSEGEKRLQEKFGTERRADAFYDNAMHDHLTARMDRFVRERTVGFFGFTADRVSSVRICHGRDLVTVVDRSHLEWSIPKDLQTLRRTRTADYGTLMTVDWEDTTVGLHVNGELSVEEISDAIRCRLAIEEAYIHCAKHLPQLVQDLDAAPPNPIDGLSPVRREDLTDEMLGFISDRINFMLGTADSGGETDISPRFGPQGFVQFLDGGEQLAYPEYRGNGVHASLGNMIETERARFAFVDWWRSGTILYVEGPVELIESGDPPGDAVDLTGLDRTKVWVVLDPERVELTRKVLPRFGIAEFDPKWGTDDEQLKRSGYFRQDEDATGEYDREEMLAAIE